MTQDNKTVRKRRGAACCAVVPILLALLALVIYLRNNRVPDVTVPTHSTPADNARDYFLRADNLTGSMRHVSPYNSSAPVGSLTLANYADAANDAEPALAIMRQGLSREFSEPAVRDDGPSFLVNSHWRNLERINSGAADYYELAGKPGRAMQMHLDGLEMAVMVPHGGVLLSFLVGAACESISEYRMEKLIPRLNREELKEAAGRLLHISAKRAPYSEIVREEGYEETAFFAQMFRDPKQRPNSISAAMNLMEDEGGDAQPSLRERISARMRAIRFLMQDKTQMLRENLDYYNRVADACRAPYTGKLNVPRPANFIADTFCDMMDKADGKSAAHTAALELICLEVALRRYYMDHGRYPRILAELAPEYLAAVPADPCGGGPLHYQIAGAGAEYILYSIGADLKDDHGSPAKYIPDQPGDIVAGKLYQRSPDRIPVSRPAHR